MSTSQDRDYERSEIRSRPSWAGPTHWLTSLAALRYVEDGHARGKVAITVI